MPADEAPEVHFAATSRTLLTYYFRLQQRRASEIKYCISWRSAV